MKRIIFLLLAVFVLSTGFSPASVKADNKDNWVYNLKPRFTEATTWMFYMTSPWDGTFNYGISWPSANYQRSGLFTIVYHKPGFGGKYKTYIHPITAPAYSTGEAVYGAGNITAFPVGSTILSYGASLVD